MSIRRHSSVDCVFHDVSLNLKNCICFTEALHFPEKRSLRKDCKHFHTDEKSGSDCHVKAFKVPGTLATKGFLAACFREKSLPAKE